MFYREVYSLSKRLTEDFYDDGSGSIRHCEISDNIEINCGGEDYQNIIDKLAEYEMAEQEGRLIILPCKIGDILYEPRHHIISEFKVISITLELPDRFHINTILIKGVDLTGDMFTNYDIGEKVFLTYEEAEDVLRDREDK